MLGPKFYRRLVFLGALIACSFVPRASEAQGDALVGRIIGEVSDETGGVLPGATVTITSPALRVGEMVAVTGASGEYRFVQLPVGTYIVEYALTGFQLIKLEGIRLTAGFTARLDQEMSVGGLEETVTVTGESPQVDVTATATTTQVTREALETIPTGRNGYIGLMQFTPGARPPIDVGGSTNNQNPSFRAFGQSADAWQLIDGVVTNNPRIGDSGNYFDFTAFEEATVETVGHDASVPARGIHINTVIKSGGNQLQGAAFYGFTNSSLQATGTDEGTELKNRMDVNGEIGGKIKQDKIWFWFGARHQRNLVNLAGTGGDNFCSREDGSQCVITNLSYFFTPKITWQVNDSDKITGYGLLNRRDDTENINALTAWETRRNQTSPWGTPTNGAAKIDWTGVRGDNLVLTALAGGFWNKSGTFFIDGTESLIHMRDRGNRKRKGTSHRVGERQGEKRMHFKVHSNYYIAGDGNNSHDLKIGADYFHVGGNRNVLDRGQAQNYRLDYDRDFTRPRRLYVWNYPVRPSINIRYLGLYVADSWTIKRRLTLNLGVRFANDRGFEGESSRVSGTGPGATVYSAQDFPRQDMPTFNTLAPRLRGSFDVFGDGRTVIKGGWGRYRAMRQSDDIHMVAQNFLGTTVYDWRNDANGNLLYDEGEVDLDLNGDDFRSQELSGAQDFLANAVVNPDEVAPITDEFLVQFEHQVARDVAVRASGIYSKASKQYRLLNTTRPPEVFNMPIVNPDPGPDGDVGTSDDPGTTFTYFDYADEISGLDFQNPTLFNDPKADRSYKSVELALSKRLSNNFQFMGSFSTTKIDEPYSTDYEEALLNPNYELFRGNDTWEWIARASGSYLFPHDIQLSGNFEHRSGDPWARWVVFEGGENVDELETPIEPLSSNRLPHINLVDIRLQKGFRFADSQQVQLRLNIYNILNQTPATEIEVFSGSSFGRVLETLLPRIIDFQIQYRF